MNSQKELSFNFFKKDNLIEKHKNFHKVSLSIFSLVMFLFILLKLIPIDLIETTKLNNIFYLLIIISSSFSSVSFGLKGIFYLNKFNQDNIDAKSPFMYFLFALLFWIVPNYLIAI